MGDSFEILPGGRVGFSHTDDFELFARARTFLLDGYLVTQPG